MAVVTIYRGGLVKVSVGVTRDAYLLQLEGLFPQGSRPGRTFGKSVGGMFEMYNSDWSNGIRYQNCDTTSEIEVKSCRVKRRCAA